jgi:hypothetical protein
LVLVATALWFGRRTQTAFEAPGAGPADCIEQMFAAAERGDVEAYLDCFTGAERERLERELALQPRDDYSRSLMQSIRDLKGRAVFEASASDQPFEATIIVERIYAHRIERQIYRLARESGTWRIAAVQAAAPLQPEKAYGQPVFELAPGVEQAPP